MAKLRYKKGTMNSKKSADLIMTNHNYIEQDKRTLVFKPKSDTKTGSFVSSRALDIKIPAITVGEGVKRGMFYLTQAVKPDCVLVDEVQFMPVHQIDELGEIVDLLGIPVIVYGLVTDFQTKMFDGSRRLFEIGAMQEELITVCWECKSRAVYNMRLKDGVPIFTGEQIMIGGNESYKPVCRSCYNKAKVKSLANNVVMFNVESKQFSEFGKKHVI
jgi:thymidine kinase